MNKRYLVVEVLDHHTNKLRNIWLEDDRDPVDAVNSIMASGKVTGVYSFVDEKDVRVESLTEKVSRHFLDIKQQVMRVR